MTKTATLVLPNLAIASLFLVAMCRPSMAQIAELNTTSSSGTVSTAPAVVYTLTDRGGTAQDVSGASCTLDGVWCWTDFPEFAGSQAQTLTISFSALAPVKSLIFGVDSASAQTGFVTISGGNALLSDFNLTESLPSSFGDTLATWNPAIGMISSPGSNQGIMIGSVSSHTISKIQIQLGASGGGTDSYGLFFGFAQPALTTAPTPEPASAAMLLLGVLPCAWIAWRRASPRVP